ncbi:beta strand repeat-containing protein [Flavobacterium restrictum]|uniref:T9SS type A sorting domain-containing protein n=1 Tax=Flavobacterium restrictum TaxID=2594428 RepID=A0A553DWD3_9FLAO|nr:T9SS type A sorting domain-containing protein [Flavobacterium restrictum]TRX37068.1 T9SS type A sorting domain-containing protein [Flavobacterium restrictum]
MKKNYLIAILVLIANLVNAQIEQTSYRGAFAPAPTAMWTDSWTNYDPQNATYGDATVTVSADITANTTWTTGKVYALSGLITVRNNAILTIQPGVIVRGAGTGAALVITKGAKINAIGTAANPIVFTSNKAVGSRNKGDWGGIILLGKGAFNLNNGVNNIEGLTASVYTEYGGGLTPDNTDSSGTLKYVRIEFGGYVYAPNNEINGLTMGAVGSGTTIDYVQVSFANDDAFEWFGGAVNCKHLVSYRNLDDDFDTDNGFSGNVQFALAIRDPQIADNPSVSTSEGFESDNNATGTSATPATSAIFTNCTLIGPSYRVSSLTNGGTLASGYKRGARIRRASQLKIFNSLFMDFQEGVHIDGVAAENNAVAGTLKFKNNILAGIVTTSKVIQVTSPGTITAGNNAAFNMTNWYTANGNSTVASNSGLLANAYGTDATTYTGLDYRPASGSIVEEGSDFTDSAFTGKLIATTVVADAIEFTSYRGAFAPAPTAMWTNNWTNYDPQNTVYSATGITVSGEITANTTWTTGNTYLLQGLTYVKNGATLTIQPGVTIRGAGVGASLIITKGSKINAVGTATSPIVFTSNNAAGSRNKGDWGGIILLGNGSFNLNSGVNNIEGITASADTQYGGGLTPDDADNSGTLKYVRIEFGGYVYAPNSEINGLTMGAVGSGTTIDYVQVSFANDDAFEWFGGAVNCKHLVSYRNLDDDFDTDNGFSGKVQYALAIRDPQISDNPSVSTSEGFESDNNATGTSATPYTSAIFTNCTLIGPSYRVGLTNGGTLASGFKRGARIRRASKLSIYNSIFMDFQEGLHIDGVAAETNAVNGDLKFKNNILAGIVTTARVLQVTSPGTLTAGNNPAFNITSWYAANGNTTQAASAGLLTLPYNTDATVYTGLDYRPATGSAALSNSNFTGLVSKIAPVVVTPVNLCKGSVATALTATLAGGVSLKWYSKDVTYKPAVGTAAPVAIVDVPLATAPVPATTVAPSTKSYFVSQVYADGTESPRAAIVVNVTPILATPGTITGTTAQGALVGTTTTATYTIAEVVDAVSYLWTAPLGMNIVSGQGTNTVTVNFNNVPTGAGSIGNISVAAVNAAGCNSLFKVLALTKALPAAPSAVKLTDALLPLPVSGIPTAVSSFAKYMGQSTVLTITATPVATATSYVWELPTGVTLLSGATTTSGVTSGTSNVITVNFSGVTSANTFNYLTTATVPVSTNVLRIGVKSKNGTGLSVTSNATAVSPTTTSTAKLLTLKAVLPKAPSAIKLTNDAVSTVTAVTAISKFIGTSTPFTLTATASLLASSYSWELPAGVTQLSGGNSNVITVDFSGVGAGTTALYIGVKAVNGIGSSVTVNAGLESTAKLLKLITAVPAAVSVVTGQLTALCGNGSYDYTLTPSLLASSYVIAAPEGSIVTSASNPDNTTNVLATSDLTFSVKYNGLVSTTAAPKYITIASVNGVGTSVLNKSLKLVTGSCSVARQDSSTKDVVTVTATEVYPNPTYGNFNVDVVASRAGVLEMTIYSFDGTVAVNTKSVQLQEGSNTISEDVSSLRSGIYLVQLVNAANNEVIVKKMIKK